MQNGEVSVSNVSLVLSVNDVSMLFTRLDENNDGQVTLNELWKHSMIYKVRNSLKLF